jgi:hypothetical protein
MARVKVTAPKYSPAVKDMTHSIIQKWRQQKVFIRFIDGNKLNCSVDNLEYVSLAECMKNTNTWVADWDLELTKEEVTLVLNSEWRDGLVL